MTKLLLLSALVFFAFSAMSQERSPSSDQNPDYADSRARYMKISDSLTRLQSTTSQETYKAIDYLADKKEAREAAKQFRRDLQMERVRNRGYKYYRNYGNYGIYSRPYFNRWSNSDGWRAIRYPYWWY